MITGFRHKGLKRLYDKDDVGKLSQDMVSKIRIILAALDEAQKPEDMDRLSFRLHPLTGDRKGQWSVTVKSNWRIVFVFDGQHVSDVDFLDYH
jgi:proteic killer suppression protein